MLRPYFHLVVRNWSFTHLLQLSLSYSVCCNYPIVMLQRIRPEMQFVFLEIGWKSTLMLLPSKILWSQIWAHNQLRLTMHKNCISLCLMWKKVFLLLASSFCKLFSSLFVIWSVQYSFYYSFYPEAHFCLFLLSAFTKMGVQLQDNQKGEFIITYNLLQQTFSKLNIWRKLKLYWQYGNYIQLLNERLSAFVHYS